MPDVSERTLRRWAEALAGIARTGLGFTESQYEQERFEEILRIAGRHPGVGRRGRRERPSTPTASWPSGWARSGKGVAGYVTPKVAVGAAVSNDEGELLLIKRADSGVWLYPTGWCDVGYSAAEVVTKEVAEETGIEVEPVRLIGVLDGLRLGMSRIPLYSLLFFCRAVGGDAPRASARGARTSAGSPSPRCPNPLVGYERWGEPVFAALRGEVRDVYYDTLRRPVWRGGARDDPRRARRGRRPRAGRRGPAPPAAALGERP